MCVHAWGLIVLEKEVEQHGSYRSGGIALINGVFEVCAKLIKCDDLKNNRQCVSLFSFINLQKTTCDIYTVKLIIEPHKQTQLGSFHPFTLKKSFCFKSHPVGLVTDS